MDDYRREIDLGRLWSTIHEEARRDAQQFPLLADFYQQQLLQHDNFGASLAYILATKLSDDPFRIDAWHAQFSQLMDSDPTIEAAALKDLCCQLQSNASIKDHYTPLLHFGGYQALQAHRLAHACWQRGDQPLANYIQGRVVSLYGVDIHPAARIGAGIFIDHAVGIVIGETAVIEDEVTIFQSVTLGGTGKGQGDRHPKIRRGAFIGSGALVLGNIEIGAEAKVAAGAVVVKPVAANQTVVGSAARLIGAAKLDASSAENKGNRV
ncbi:serine acetyltransferase [Motiliproteus coralliicola]|uniref:Serine acetyltransferase n=1 Tax=Motiliproteus coralliicola TaxID=2283196 RepID=A0A369WEH3_9GAMM|nr:serine O-acetyltransferase EpsC [Motiliproteus coralliicola]RDE19016.1 serine acetyltransferase [Motiliproteus coralliicola]